MGRLDETGSVFALANGWVGWRATLDEGEPYEMPGSHLNGFHEQHELSYPEGGEQLRVTGPEPVSRPMPPVPDAGPEPASPPGRRPARRWGGRVTGCWAAAGPARRTSARQPSPAPRTRTPSCGT
ncbi:hypothetical protein [Micromonospora schwarzwaldensis]